MKIKIIFLSFLVLILSLNFYFLKFKSDIFSKSKIQISKLDGSTSYLGRFKLWQLLVQNNDWASAATLESGLNKDQVKNYKSANQPSELQKRVSFLSQKSPITADDYLEIARIQSILNSPSQSIEAIKKAHQLDPIRSDVDKLFYSLAK